MNKFKKHSFLYYPLQWMSEAEQDKTPIYNKIFNWKSHISPIIICGITIIILVLINKFI